ncbi:MAG: Asp-tRNA(Asn)/Glu-tRNA(Gln) amidotransferase subunit GatB, partial [Candidatus Limnocylindrales bacterium]
ELGRLLRLVEDGTISRTSAKTVFERHATTGERVEAIVEDLGLTQITDRGALLTTIDAVLAANPDAVADVRAGRAQAQGFLVGQVMKATRGQAKADAVQALLHERLEAG